MSKHLEKALQGAAHKHTFAEKVAAISGRPGFKPRTPGQTKKEAARRIAGWMIRREGRR